jgi:hypothetical protein
MDKIIVYVDDAPHAQQLLAPLAAQARAGGQHWVLVACAPRMTHRVSKWVSHSARENWRTKWADKLFAQLAQAMDVPGHQVTTVIAKGPLGELTDSLQAEIKAGGARAAQVIDARKPRAVPEAGASAPPLSALSPWPRVLGSVLAGCGTLWALSLD